MDVQIEAQLAFGVAGNFREADLEHDLLPAGDLHEVQHFAVVADHVGGLLGNLKGGDAALEHDGVVGAGRLDCRLGEFLLEQRLDAREVVIDYDVHNMAVVVIVPKDDLGLPGAIASNENAGGIDFIVGKDVGV